MRAQKIARNDAYKILRSLKDVPCLSPQEESASEKLGHLSPGRVVDQLQSFANTDKQTTELNRRCRAAGLQFFFDQGGLVQFRKIMEEV
ncbi:hypothetical protein NMR92_001351 [Vibrio cholerae]|uniref:Uncharacterized protein n=2 Tax=Vibrio TaxID=662 RepID=A0A1B1LRF8_VIBPH|nr:MULTISPECIES: hypothetical protein [Vibrio]ANS55631.1 hypothetical protein [Vibrio parahaemolyticus]EJL6460705.1 hypothetical protein [Vibrio cholerae]EJL6490451.1 hypothetical protein [Vibrio cholerae]EJL6642142.1 hypothetical protein [Vibrio cholerae]MBJ6953146.1 hypothetical protein [Vibrio cholerae]